MSIRLGIAIPGPALQSLRAAARREGYTLSEWLRRLAYERAGLDVADATLPIGRPPASPLKTFIQGPHTMSFSQDLQ